MGCSGGSLSKRASRARTLLAGHCGRHVRVVSHVHLQPDVVERVLVRRAREPARVLVDDLDGERNGVVGRIEVGGKTEEVVHLGEA